MAKEIDIPTAVGMKNCSHGVLPMLAAISSTVEK
jgi:hypothetical protein